MKSDFRSESFERKIQPDSVCLHSNDWDALERKWKIITIKAFEQRNNESRINIDPGFSLIGLRKTGPWVERGASRIKFRDADRYLPLVPRLCLNQDLSY